jgi:hypothetical protein
MRDLAYALTCQSVQEAFAEWDVITARARVVDMLRDAVEVHLPPQEKEGTPVRALPTFVCVCGGGGGCACVCVCVCARAGAIPGGPQTTQAAAVSNTCLPPARNTHPHHHTCKLTRYQVHPKRLRLLLSQALSHQLNTLRLTITLANSRDNRCPLNDSDSCCLKHFPTSSTHCVSPTLRPRFGLTQYSLTFVLLSSPTH